MKDQVLRTVLVGIYMILMAATLNFRISKLLNFPVMMYLLVITALLTWVRWLRNKEQDGLRSKLSMNLFLSGIFLTLLYQGNYLYHDLNAVRIQGVIDHFLPLFYGMFMVMLIDLFHVNYEGNHSVVYKVPIGKVSIDTIGLTQNEAIIGKMLFDDLTINEIATVTHMTEHMVNQHIASVLVKAHVPNRIALVHEYTISRGDEIDGL